MRPILSLNPFADNFQFIFCRRCKWNLNACFHILRRQQRSSFKSPLPLDGVLLWVDEFEEVDFLRLIRLSEWIAVQSWMWPCRVGGCLHFQDHAGKDKSQDRHQRSDKDEPLLGESAGADLRASRRSYRMGSFGRLVDCG